MMASRPGSTAMPASSLASFSGVNAAWSILIAPPAR
jgi:hypothetical protein